MTGRFFTHGGVLVLAFVALFTLVAGARADVVVPDDYPTIQSAIDANVGVVHIKTGDYDEVLRIGAAVVLDAEAGYPAFNYPTIKGLAFTDAGASLRMSGVRVRQPVNVVGARRGLLSFESCRFDSGLVIDGHDGPEVRLRGCMVFGGANLETGILIVYGCTFVRGGLYGTWAESGWVCGNYVTGPAPWGIYLSASSPSGEILSNVITGTDIGIVPSAFGIVSDNEISNCTFDGIGVLDPGLECHVTITSNRIRDCGRDGIRTTRGYKSYDSQNIIRFNRVERTGADGIIGLGMVTLTGNTVLDAGGYGIVADSCAYLMPTHGNTVLRARLDGMRLPAQETIDANVVGHNGGNGLVLVPRLFRGLSGRYRISQNTAYGNGGSGIVVEDVFAQDVNRGITVVDTVQLNLLYANGRYGLEWTGDAASRLGCNDYYANTLGMAAGLNPGPGDMSIEPLLCDVAGDDVGLRPDSPLLHAPGCLPVGARGVGCAALAAVPTAPPPGALGFAVGPRPAMGEVRFAWTPPGAPVRLEVFDLEGARHLDETLDGTRAEYRWSARGADGRDLPAGVYYARITTGSRHETSPVVIVR